MKNCFPFLVVLLLVISACTTSPTDKTKTVGDSSIASVDSPAIVVDSAKVADVPPISVDSASDGTSTANSEKVLPATGKYLLSVSFISMGAGIDHAAKKKYDQYIKDFGSKYIKGIAHETVGWGREGEVDYCFRLTELETVKKKLFIAETKKMLASNELIQITENTACRVPNK